MRLRERLGPSLADEHRERRGAGRCVVRQLVDVLAHQHASWAAARTPSPPPDTCQGSVPVPRVVDAADHQRAPRDEHVELAEPALLQPQRRAV